MASKPPSLIAALVAAATVLLPHTSVSAGEKAAGRAAGAKPPHAPFVPTPSDTNADGGDVPAGATGSDPRDRVLLGGTTGRLGPQRADFAPPDMLLVAYEEAWLDAVEAIARQASPTTDVFVMVDPQEARARDMTDWARSLGATLLGIELDTPWVRDYGPLQRIPGPGKVVWLDFDYGTERRLDDEVPITLVSQFGVPLQRSIFSLDGGAVVSNGAGLCAISDRSLDDAGVDQNDEPAVEAIMQALGCEVVAAIPDLPDEPTGHADMMVQFVARNRAIVIELDAEDHPDDAMLADIAAEALALAATAAGQSLKITRVPAHYEESDGTLYSYVNGVRLRDRYLVPQFSAVSPTLAHRAEAALHDAMPGVTLAPIPSDEVLSSAGVLHCITLGLSLPHVRL